jgi:hypothetical protein
VRSPAAPLYRWRLSRRLLLPLRWCKRVSRWASRGTCNGRDPVARPEHRTAAARSAKPACRRITGGDVGVAGERGTRRVHRHRSGCQPAARTNRRPSADCRYFVLDVTAHARPFHAQMTLIRKRSQVRVLDRPLDSCRAFLNRLRRAPCRKVRDGSQQGDLWSAAVSEHRLDVEHRRAPTASSALTCTRAPSIERIRTSCRPIGFGRAGERVLKTPWIGFARSPRGCTRRTSRSPRSLLARLKLPLSG